MIRTQEVYLEKAFKALKRFELTGSTKEADEASSTLKMKSKDSTPF